MTSRAARVPPGLRRAREQERKSRRRRNEGATTPAIADVRRSGHWARVQCDLAGCVHCGRRTDIAWVTDTSVTWVCPSCGGRVPRGDR